MPRISDRSLREEVPSATDPGRLRCWRSRPASLRLRHQARRRAEIPQEDAGHGSDLIVARAKPSQAETTPARTTSPETKLQRAPSVRPGAATRPRPPPVLRRRPVPCLRSLEHKRTCFRAERKSPHAQGHQPIRRGSQTSRTSSPWSTKSISTATCASSMHRDRHPPSRRDSAPRID